ncbi:MAG TPA: hypothetical protein VIP70_01960 [Nitrososphaeraceae archaeon]
MLVQKVEEFIRRLHDGIYTIDPKANEIMFSNPSKSTDKSLTAYLTEEMYEYQTLSTLSSRIAAASCLMWINRAFTYGVVKEDEGLVNRLIKKDEQISILKEGNTKLHEEVEKYAPDLVFKYDELNTKFHRIVSKGDKTFHE